MIDIHKLETFTADDPDLGPASVLVLEGFDGQEEIQTFLSELLQQNHPETSEIWRTPRVEKETGLCEATIRRRVHKKEFPPPLCLGSRAKGWIAAEVIAWKKARPRRWVGESRKPVALRKQARPRVAAATQTKGNAEPGATAAA